MLSLKSVLLLNGISSGITGLGLVLFAPQVAELFQIGNSKPFTYTGIFLVIFALFVVKTALTIHAKRQALTVITLLDSAWIVGSIALLIGWGASISLTGNVVIVAVAAWVALMAVMQVKSNKETPGSRAGSRQLSL